MRFLSRFFDSNDRELGKIQPLIDRTNDLEPEYEGLTDDEIRARIDVIREDVLDAAGPEEPSEDELHSHDLERRRDLAKARRKRENERLQSVLDDVVPEVFAAGREAMKRTLGMRQFDVQLMGGIVLHQGKIAEMRTGEGKTLIADARRDLNAPPGRGVHVVTVNDYLARRDAQWMGPIYHFLGLTRGRHQHEHLYVFEPGFPTTDERLINLRPVTRREAYAADITYGTNNEFGFDYLRDNMVTASTSASSASTTSRSWTRWTTSSSTRRGRRSSSPARPRSRPTSTHLRPAGAAPQAAPGGRRRRAATTSSTSRTSAVSPTEEGIDKIEQLLGIENLYDADPRLARHFDSALKAHALYKRDRDYIVKDGEIVIVDEFTGRMMPGRRWSEGLHQAIEAKEGCESSARTRPWPPSRSRTTSACTTSWPA